MADSLLVIIILLVAIRLILPYIVLKYVNKTLGNIKEYYKCRSLILCHIFYTCLLVIIITCVGFAFGKEAIQGQISGQISGAMGADTAKQVEDIIAKAGSQKNSILATVISSVTLILGATGVFSQLQTSLNLIWEVKVTAKKNFLKTIKDRVFSFGLILSIGFLLLVSLLLTTGLATFSGWVKTHLPDFMLLHSHKSFSVYFFKEFKIR